MCRRTNASGSGSALGFVSSPFSPSASRVVTAWDRHAGLIAAKEEKHDPIITQTMPVRDGIAFCPKRKLSKGSHKSL